MYVCMYIYIYIYIYIHTHTHGAFNKFPDFFVQAFKIVIDSWKFSMLLLYIFGDDWQIFMISGSNEQLQQQLEYSLLRPDCHSWWFSALPRKDGKFTEQPLACSVPTRCTYDDEN